MKEVNGTEIHISATGRKTVKIWQLCK
jgi:hypothetical protein